MGARDDDSDGGGAAQHGGHQGSTLTFTRSPLESKISSVESEKCQLTKNY